MDIVALAPDSDLVDAVTPLRSTLTETDSPWNEPSTVRQFTAMLTHGWDGEPPRFWVGLRDGEPVALGSLWTSTHDNLDHAWFGVDVRPDLRRHGLGTQMLSHLQEQALAENRPKVGFSSWESDALDGFAARHGYERASQAIQRRQDLTALPDGWRDQLADALRNHASAYELVEVDGALPEGQVEAMVQLWSDINDAPTDDLDIEDEVFTVARLRGYEQAQRASGIRLRHLVARHRQTGELGGHTLVGVEEERPHRAHQHDTTVARSHRGHRLGLVLKASMMDLLFREEPQVRTVDTWNAESNDHMIAVNAQLGYQVMGRSIAYQRTLD